MIDQLLDELRRRDIRIWADGGRLKYEAPKDARMEDLLPLLRLHKDALLKRSASVHGVASAGMPRADRSRALPLSFAQQRMWFLWKLAPDSLAYNVPSVVKLSGRLNLTALTESLRAIQRRHEVLRTHFVETPDGAAQVVDTDSHLDVPLEDLTDIGPEAREETARLRVRAQVARPFDLRKAAPFEARVYRLGETVHWLLVKLHHIVADGWSFSIFWREFAVLYESLDRGSACTLKDLPIQYADFAAWQRERLQGPLRERLLSYWKQQLRGGPAALKLPTDHPRPPVQSMRGDTVTFQLPPDLHAALAALGRARHATLFMILLSAFRILLHRYSGQTDFLIGTPTLWRSHHEMEALIGYFANTLVLRNPLRETDSYLDVLARERQTALDSYEHQEIPFGMLVEELAPERALGHNPLFQAMFVFGERDLEIYRLPDLDVGFSDVATSTAKFDLRLWMQETEAGLMGEIEYATDLFERATVMRMAGHLEVLLAAIVRRPDSPIGEIPLLTAQEQRVLLREWNDTALSVPHDRCLHELFEAQAQARPHATAVYYGEEKITYAALNEAAERLAHSLTRYDLQPEQRVGVCLRRSPRLIAALLGVLKTGAAYVPIDPSYPPERIKLMLDDSRVRVLLTERDIAHRLPELESVALVFDDEVVPPAQHGRLTRRVTPDHLAYVLYTSGSTGRPKGVMIEHKSAAALLHWAYRVYDPDEIAAVLAATSVCFDLSVFELFVPLCTGHSVVLAENALALAEQPARDTVTLINTVPSVMRALLRAYPGPFPASLRVVNLAGERLETRLVDEVYRRTRAAKVYDLYGPTEATTYSLFKLRLPQRPPSIGRPVANTRIYVLDGNGLPVPVGVVGELYLAGAGLARGYLDRPDLTAERFVAPRSGMIPEDRLYRTGDLVSYTPTGEIAYHGRNDDQVKVRGFRIELGEVKAALLTADGVEDALVAERRDPDGGNYLAAYVVGDPVRFSSTHARLHLKKLLPEYMIPSVFVRVDAFPLSPNGKVDLGRLTEPKEEDQTAEPDLPRTETEQQMIEIWKEMFDAPRIGVHDNFFDLGGHSLTAMRAAARLNETFDIDLPLQAVFEHPTVYELAAAVEGMPRGARAVALPPLRAQGRRSAPLTLLQRQLWRVHLLAGDSSFLNITQRLNLKGRLDLAAAQQALRALLERHPILRAKIVVDGEQLRQEAVVDGPSDIALADLSGLRDTAARDEALTRVYREAVRPFDIERESCSRFVIARLSETHHVLFMVLHHLIVDEWSLDVLAKEFALCYGAFVNGLPAPLAPPRVTFADYAAWEQECFERRLFDPQLAFWKEKLKPPLPRLAFPWRDGQAPARQMESTRFAIGAELCDRLSVLARRERASLFVVLLSTLKRLLQRQTGASDLRVCTNLARRHQRGLQEMVGPLIDTLVLRTALPADHTPLGALRRVRSTFIEACGHHDVPFDEIAFQLASESRIRREDLAQAFFLFHEADEPMPPLPGLATEDDAAASGDSDFFKAALHGYDLVLYLYKSADGMRGQFTLRGAPGAGPVGAEMVRAYTTLLEELVEAPVAIDDTCEEPK